MSKLEKRKLGWRIGWTIVLVILWVVAAQIWTAYQGSIEAEIAVNQLNDDATDYAASKAVAEGLIGKLINWAGVILLALMWIPFTVNRIRLANA